MPNLIQRINRKERFRSGDSAATPDSERSFDQIFDLDYMGSAEFEYGAVPTSYRLLLAAETTIRPVELTRGEVTRTVYFIATDDAAAYDGQYDYSTNTEITRFDQVLARFKEWFQAPQLRSKEITYFDMLFEGVFPSYMEEFRPKVVAWWDLRENIAWTLDESVAQDLLQAFTVQPRASRV